MKITMKSKVTASLIFGALMFYLQAEGAIEECPPPLTCAPCGETMINTPLPAMDSCGVQPYQNYLATYESCIRSGWNGFYIGTGFGAGQMRYNLTVNGLTLPQKSFSNSYIIEYATIGYAHSSTRFFIAGELGFYYDSVTKPIFYEDPGSIVFASTPTLLDPVPVITTVIPCSARLDINAQDHVALDLLPGFAVTPRLTLFGRVGVEYTSYTWNRRICIPKVLVDVDFGEIVFVDVNDVNVAGTGDAQDDQTANVIDLRLGLGVAFAASRYVSFTLNYIHIFGTEATFTPDAAIVNSKLPAVLDINSGLQLPGTFTFTTNTLFAQNVINPSRNEVLFGVMFTF